MKFVCERCHTRYSIADDKVRQKILKIRCKTCENVITVRDSGPVATMAFGQSPLAPPPPPVRSGPAGAREWFVAVNGEQTGPLTRADAAKRIVHGKHDDEIYVWKDGLDGWKAPEDVAAIHQEVNALKARPSAPVPRIPAPPPTRPAGKAGPVRSTKAMPAPFVSPRAGAASMGSVPATARVADTDSFAEDEHTEIQPFDAGMIGADILARSAAASGPGAVLPFTAPSKDHRAEPAAAAPAPAALDGLFNDLTPAPAAVPHPGAPAAPAAPALSGLSMLSSRRPSAFKFIAAAAVVMVLIGLVVVVLVSKPTVAPPPPPPTAAKTPPVAEEPKPVVENELKPRPPVPENPAPVVREVPRRTGKGPARSAHPAAAATPSLEPAPLSPDQATVSPHKVASGERRVPEFRSARPAAAPSGPGGPSEAMIGAVVKKRENQAALKSCYERALKRDDRLNSARIDVSASVGMSGIVKSVSLVAPPEFVTVETCIKTAVRHWAFPANTEEYKIEFPLLLQGNR